MRLTRIHVSGMDCPTEETVIRRALLGIDGVTDVRCELMLRRVAVKHADSIETSRILSELSAIGLPGIVASAAEREEDCTFPISGIPGPSQSMRLWRSGAFCLAGLLAGEIKAGYARNVVKSRQFSEMLKKTLNAYHNRAVTSQEVIEELMRLTRTIRESKDRGERLGLTPQEEAFYDALADNESAVRAMGDPKLRVVAQELVTAMRKNTSVDWTIKETVRAKIRVVVKRILRHHGFPPDLQDSAVKLVLEQAETLCKDWTGE